MLARWFTRLFLLGRFLANGSIFDLLALLGGCLGHGLAGDELAARVELAGDCHATDGRAVHERDTVERAGQSQERAGDSVKGHANGPPRFQPRSHSFQCPGSRLCLLG